MTGREKILAALSPDGTPEIPVVLCYSDIYYRDHWEMLTDQPWWALRSADMERHRATYRDMIRNVGQDWFTLPLGPTRDDQKNLVIEEREGRVYRLDHRTREKRAMKRPAIGGWRGGELHSVTPEDPPRNCAELDEQIDIPNEEAVRAHLNSGATELTELLKQNDARDLFWLASCSTPFWHCYSIWGFAELMRKPFDDPKLLHYACERAMEARLRALRLWAKIGAHGVWIEECMTDMLSPAAYTEFNLPYLRRLTDAIRREGMFSIYYYCGNPHDRMDLLLDSGADALSLEEGKKGWQIDIAQVAERVQGRMTLLGNLDAINLLEHGPDNALRAEIARQIAAGRRNGSRFIMSLGSPVTPGTSVERVRRYIEMTHDEGSQGLTSGRLVHQTQSIPGRADTGSLPT